MTIPFLGPRNANRPRGGSCEAGLGLVRGAQNKPHVAHFASTPPTNDARPEQLQGARPKAQELLLLHCRPSDLQVADVFLSQEPSEWDESRGGHLHLDTSQATLVIRPQPSSTSGPHKAPLAPKQGLGGALANARGQHQSPISGTYALRTPRGKITSIACESCRKRKSKVRPPQRARVKPTDRSSSAMVSAQNATPASPKTSHASTTSPRMERRRRSCAPMSAAWPRNWTT